jgi:diguanylate cyclase (GGDEF)-like protein
MGAADCLTEPVDPEVLRQKLRVFVELEAYRAGLRATLEQTRAESRRLQDENRRLAERQEMLRHQSTHDPLTGLPNAALLEDRLDGALRRAARNRQRVAVVMVDFDGFRTVNDAHGPAAGDALLAAASRNLLQAVRASDTVARLGADRFVVVLEALHSATAAAQLGGKLAAAVAQPCTVRTSGRTIQLALAASLGVALGPDHGDQREDLLAAAEAAMYAARRDGDGVRMHAPAAAPTLALVGGLQAS